MKRKKEISPLLKDLKYSRRKMILFFTAIFAVLSAFLYGVFFGLNGKSMVWSVDGLTQYCLVLAYYGEYLRTILRNIFIEHTFVIPMFDFSVGLGTDIVSSLHYYGIGDPLNLLSVFVKPEYTEYLFGFISILRMYISGITFILFMSRRNNHINAVVTGAVQYAFSSYCLFVAARHPFFITGMIYIPLLFLGIDKILEHGNPLVYILSVALLLMSNFYFAYTSFIIMLFYAALRYFDVCRKQGAKGFFKTVGKFAGYTVNGFLISMIIFLPQIKNTLSTGRLNVENYVGTFYQPSYYASLPATFADGATSSNWYIAGFTGVSLLCLMLCFVRAKKHKNIVISFCLCLVAGLFPVFGHMFNGFAYVTNRWSYIFGFIAAVAVVYGYDELFELSNKEKKVLWITAAIYILLVLCLYNSRTQGAFITLAVMMTVLCLAAMSECIGISIKKQQTVVSGILIVCIVFQGVYFYSYTEADTGKHEALGDIIYYMRDATTSALVNTTEDDGEFYRFDDYSSSYSYNSAMLNDNNSTSTYLSIANAPVAQFFNEIGLNTEMEQMRKDLSHRYILQSLTGCKYQSGSVNFAKYKLYSETDYSMLIQNRPMLDSNYNIAYYRGRTDFKTASVDRITLSELKYYMPMGYTYDTVMSREEYEKLTPIEKQNVLLQTAVTDGTNALPEPDIRSGDVREYDIFELISQSELPDGISVDGHTITVTDTSAELRFTLPSKAFSECCVTVDTLSFEDISPYEITEAELESEINSDERNSDDVLKGNNTNKIDPISLRKLNTAKNNFTGAQTVHIYASSEMLNSSAKCDCSTPKFAFYSGNDTYAVYLGTTFYDVEDAVNTDTITIRFSNTGVYKMDNFLVSYQGLSNIKTDYKARTEDVLENVEITDNENTVKGTISLSEPKVLATQIPYSSGWTATVDGEKQEIINVNTAFCGLVLKAGEHTIEFHYRTPNTTASVIMSLAGIALAAVAGTVYGVVRRKREQ